MYKLLVTKLELLSEDERKEMEINLRSNGRFRGDIPPPGFNEIPFGQKPVKTLEVLLTEAEYAALKKAVIGVM